MRTEEFKEHLSKLATGVFVITAVQNENLYGCTIGSVTATNIISPELMFLLKITSTMGEVVKTQEFFTISALSQDQIGVAEIYANPRPIQKLLDLDTQHEIREINDRKFVSFIGSTLDFQCELIESLPRGNSELFFAKVIGSSLRDNRGLIYQNRKYI